MCVKKMWAGVGYPSLVACPPCSLSCVLVSSVAVRFAVFSFVWSLVMFRFFCLSYFSLVLFLMWAASQPVVPCSVDPGSGWCQAVSEPPPLG